MTHSTLAWGRHGRLVGMAAALTLSGAAPSRAEAQQGRPAAPAVLLAVAPAAVVPGTAPLVFDQVTVVDVEHGTLLAQQRVVITGNHIQRVGPARAVKLPRGARVVDAQGQYLIPGLWDMHVHPEGEVPYLLLLATGITGVRIPGSAVPLDTLQQWRREILAGTRIGPPHQVLSGVMLDEGTACPQHGDWAGHICVAPGDSIHVRLLIDSLKSAGIDMLKVYGLQRDTYFLVAAAARRAGLLFGGHAPSGVSVFEASDSGQRLLDHPSSIAGPGPSCLPAGLQTSEYATTDSNQGTVERCRAVAEHYRRNGTWWVPTLCCAGNGVTPQGVKTAALLAQFQYRRDRFWEGPPLHGNWLRDTSDAADAPTVITYGADTARRHAANDTHGILRMAQQVGLPIAAGTDARVTDCGGLKGMPPGVTLQEELATYVGEGLTPLTALQSATLNPAKAIQGTDSLGTVARGKLADLVLLDANPLEDITNTTAIAAVVANGRYFDRAALDQVLAEFRARLQQGFKQWDIWNRDPHDNERYATHECKVDP